MISKIASGAAAAVAAMAIAGCSSTTSTAAQAAAPSATGAAATTDPTAATASSSVPPATTDPATSTPAAASSTTAAASGKPVSVLLAHIAAPVTTATMPTANPAWVAAVQKTMDDGTAIDQHRGVSVNLMALVDEAAKTSDLDALIKLCNACKDPAQKAALTRAMTQTDGSGRTGFAQLSFLLEHTHPSQTMTLNSGGGFPGFATPQHSLAASDSNYAALTDVDKADMKALGVTSVAGYKGLQVDFENLDDGPDAYDGWVGLAPAY